MSEIIVKKGQLLVSETSILGDSEFTRSVILLTEHSSEGSVGFILNKPLDFTIGDLISDINSTLTVYNGGPVEQDNLYFIHTVPEKISNSVEISNGIFWGGDFDSIKYLLNTNLISKSEIRFFLGYTGWSPKQLNDEILNNSWLINENTEGNQLLSKPTNTIWSEKINSQGGDYILFSNAPEDPILN